MYYLRSTIIIALAAPVGCVRHFDTRSFCWAGDSTRHRRRLVRLPERPRVSVRLRTRTDLSKVPSEELIHAEASFCDSPRVFVLLGRTIYVDPPLTSLRDAGRSNPADSSGVYTYVVLLDVKRQGSPIRGPLKLASTYRLCRGASVSSSWGAILGRAFPSNTVQVSAETIREALVHHEVSRGG